MVLVKTATGQGYRDMVLDGTHHRGACWPAGSFSDTSEGLRHHPRVPHWIGGANYYLLKVRAAETG